MIEATFPGVTAFAFMVSLLLLGTILRAKIPFLRAALMPASLIGGLLGFMLLSLDMSFGFTAGDFTAFTFHFFTLSFMALCLTGRNSPKQKAPSAAGGLWLSLIWIMSLVMQAMMGMVAIMGYNLITGQTLSEFVGIIATHGFTQGPGQAFAIGNIWETELGISQAVNFGIVYASIGFVVAFLVGVPVARWAISHGLNYNNSAHLGEEFLSGIIDCNKHVSAGAQITHAANLDSLAFHLSILGLAYLITDQYLVLMRPIVASIDLMGIPLGLVFSHNLFFLHGLMICVLMRGIMDKFKWGHFVDNETQRRITGSAVDLMVVATLMSINFAFLSEFFAPILLVCILLTLFTALMCLFFGAKLKHLGLERALTIFGCCCGSIGSGLLLLRILDPNLSTPIAKELAFFNIAIVFIGFHILMLMAPILPTFSMTTIVSVYLGTFVVCAIAVYFLGEKTMHPIKDT